MARAAQALVDQRGSFSAQVMPTPATNAQIAIPATRTTVARTGLSSVCAGPASANPIASPMPTDATRIPIGIRKRSAIRVRGGPVGASAASPGEGGGSAAAVGSCSGWLIPAIVWRPAGPRGRVATAVATATGSVRRRRPGLLDSSTMSTIDSAEVARLAGLARIDLTPDEVQRLAGELDVIVQAVAEVSRVATPDVPATSHPIPLTNVFRDDVPEEPLPVDAVLAQAPRAEDGKFAVPQILGEDA